MCHVASGALVEGRNVLYITMEMAEERIAERIDANLMDLPIQQLESLPKNVFDSKIEKIGKGSIGKLIVKEYPTGAAHTGHFRALLNELKLYNPELLDKERILGISKCDMSEEELTNEIKKTLPKEIEHIFFSSIAEKGLSKLKDKIWSQLNF